MERGHIHRIHTTIISVPTPQRLEVGQEASFIITCIKATPWVNIVTQSATCSILPFILGWQTIIHYRRLTLRCQEVVKQLRTPYAKSISLLPGNTHYRILIKAKVPEIHLIPRLIKYI